MTYYNDNNEELIYYGYYKEDVVAAHVQNETLDKRVRTVAAYSLLMRRLGHVTSIDLDDIRTIDFGLGFNKSLDELYDDLTKLHEIMFNETCESNTFNKLFESIEGMLDRDSDEECFKEVLLDCNIRFAYDYAKGNKLRGIPYPVESVHFNNTYSVFNGRLGRYDIMEYNPKIKTLIDELVSMFHYSDNDKMIQSIKLGKIVNYDGIYLFEQKYDVLTSSLNKSLEYINPTNIVRIMMRHRYDCVIKYMEYDEDALDSYNTNPYTQCETVYQVDDLLPDSTEEFDYQKNMQKFKDYINDLWSQLQQRKYG